MKRLLKYSYISILLLLTIQALGQDFEWLSTTFPNSRFLGVYNVDGKYMGAISNGASVSYDSNTIYQISLHEIIFNDGGITLEEIANIPFEDGYATISLDFIEETGTWLIVQSKPLESLSEIRQRFRVLLCNKSFDILAEQTVDTTGFPIPFFIASNKDFTIILGSIWGPPHFIFYSKYDHNDSLNLSPVIVKQSSPNNTFGICSMIMDDDENDIAVFYYGGIAKLDSNLNQILKLGYSEINTAYYGTIIKVDTNYYTHSLTEQGTKNGYKYLLLQKYNQNFKIINADTIGVTDHDHYPFISKSLESKANEIVIGGHLDGPFEHLNLNKSIKKFFLSKYDGNLNKIWYKEYGGDRAYIIIGFNHIENEGILTYGYVTDTITGLWYAYIFYVNTHGEIVGQAELPLINSNQIIVVNPGKDYMQIYNPKGVTGTLDIISLQGKLLIRQLVLNTEHNINTSQIPAGTYPYCLYKDDKLIQSGLWIKQN